MGKKAAVSVFAAEDSSKAPTGDSFRPNDPRNLIWKTKQGGEVGERKLTNFQTVLDGSVSRIKLIEVGEIGSTGEHVLVYEVWKETSRVESYGVMRPILTYDRTILRLVDDDGGDLEPPWTLPLPPGTNVLTNDDELLLIGGKVPPGAE